MVLASLNSFGIVIRDWYQEKVMFQAWLVKIRTIAAISVAKL